MSAQSQVRAMSEHELQLAQEIGALVARRCYHKPEVSSQLVEDIATLLHIHPLKRLERTFPRDGAAGVTLGFRMDCDIVRMRALRQHLATNPEFADLVSYIDLCLRVAEERFPEVVEPNKE
jgi:hypothetical protein